MDLAKDMADNFLYEVREYGKILNANRTYYLTRSQPPFLTGMMLAVYQPDARPQWLEDAVPAIETYYRYWTTEPHLTPETGLSRYFDLGEGPAPEVLSSEHDAQGPARLRPGPRVLSKRTTSPTTMSPILRCGARSAHSAVLQRRPLHARIGLRSLQPLRPLQRRYHPLQSGLPEFAAVSDGDADGRNSEPVASRYGSRRVARACGATRRANEPADVGSPRRSLLRLRLCPRTQSGIIPSSPRFTRCGLESPVAEQAASGGARI